MNSSIGDELFSGTPAGAGGVSICTGSDYYKFNYNWVCGNLSSGDGGGVGHLGFSYNGDIEHNSILFNQSLNPTIPANGGGLLVMGTPDVDTTCGGAIDIDCLDPAILRTPSDGIGPNLLINANLIMGNAAESGSGGGLRLQNINGSDVLAFPTTPAQWYSPTVTNNIIADNVAGWDGAGISLVDALNVNIINNTVVSNSTTASAGILFTTIGSPLASSEGANCVIGTETSCPQVSGLVSIQNSTGLQANLPTTVVCPPNHYQGTTATNGTCRTFSYPLLENNIFWQNSAYYIGVGALSAQYQQNIVSLYNAFTTTLAPTQPQTDATTAHGAGLTITGGTGACVAANYWEIGVRGDTGPSNHASGVTLAPIYSVLSDVADYSGAALHNTGSNPNFGSQYCDGSRTPPEFGASGWAVPPGIADATVPNPIFNLTPVATVDEGNNWINLRWGPLSLLNPVTNTVLSNYALTTGSPIIDAIPTTEANYSLVPRTDFFGNRRPESAGDTHLDPGAVEFQAAAAAGPTLASISPTQGADGTTVAVILTGTGLSGTTAINVSDGGITVSALTVVNATTVTANFIIASGAARTARTVSVTAGGVNGNNVTFTVVGPSLTTIAPNTGVQATAVPVTLTGVNLTGTTAINVSGTGITVSGLTVVNSTTVTATFTIASSATASVRTVSVTTAGVTSNTVTFTVTTLPPPTLTSVAPNSGTHSATVAVVVPVTLTGTNLRGLSLTTGVLVSGTGVTVSNIVVVGTAGTTVTANFTIAAGAATGARTVQVRTPAGTTTQAVTFTVN